MDDFLSPHWQELERRLSLNEHVLPLAENLIDAMCTSVIERKKRKETEQIIGRLKFQSSFREADNGCKLTLRKKFRLLALYFLRVQDHKRFGHIVISSIVREWPVHMTSYAEDGGITKYTWDRAPLSIEMNDRPTRKVGDKYVMRVLALEGTDIDPRYIPCSGLNSFFAVYRAQCRTSLLEIDEDGAECDAEAFIIEREGGGYKRETPSADAVRPGKRPRGTRSKIEIQENLNRMMIHESLFELSCNYGENPIFNSSKEKKEFIDHDTNNIMFAINNIAIRDTNPRSTITKKYVLKSHFEFLFKDNISHQFFQINTADVPDPTNPLLFPMPIKSMWFEAATNASSHWEKSMPAIWRIMYEYYKEKGELTNEETKHDQISDGQMLIWRHVKGVLYNFIGTKSDIKVRRLMDSELRTISRMIVGHRVVAINSEYSGDSDRWLLNNLHVNEQRKIADRMGIAEVKMKNGRTFTQCLHSALSKENLPDNFQVKLTDFTDCMMDLSRHEPVRTVSLYYWLHGVAEMITGDFLHKKTAEFGARKSVELFNRKFIALRSKESAESVVVQTIRHFLKRRENAKILLIRFDEREYSQLLFEYIRPTHTDRRLRSQFGCIAGNVIRDIKVALAPAPVSEIQRATDDGVVKDRHIYGLYALLKSPYPCNFNRIIQQSNERLACSLFKQESGTNPVYPYDLARQSMEENEIDIFYGPTELPEHTSTRDEKITVADTDTHTMADPKISSASNPSSSAQNGPKKRVTRRKKPSAEQKIEQQPSPPSLEAQQPLAPHQQHAQPLQQPGRWPQPQQQMPASYQHYSNVPQTMPAQQQLTYDSQGHPFNGPGQQSQPASHRQQHSPNHDYVSAEPNILQHHTVLPPITIPPSRNEQLFHEPVYGGPAHGMQQMASMQHVPQSYQQHIMTSAHGAAAQVSTRYQSNSNAEQIDNEFDFLWDDFPSGSGMLPDS